MTGNPIASIDLLNMTHEDIYKTFAENGNIKISETKLEQVLRSAMIGGLEGVMRLRRELEKGQRQIVESVVTLLGETMAGMITYGIYIL